MKKDTHLIWESGFPYEILAEAGITPASSMKIVRDAIFHVPKEHRVIAQRALRELEEISRRLVVDFFLYQGVVDPQEEDQDEH